MTSYILIGDSGHGKVIEDCIVASGHRVIAKLDDKYNSQFQEGPYIKGPLSIIKELLDNQTKIIISIGHNFIRRQVVERLALKEDCYGIIKHPSAVISPSAILGYGTVIMPNVVINASSKIGHHVILNTASIIEHDCLIKDFVHISPGTVLTGGVEVGIGTQVGAKTSVNPLVKIGKWSIVGAGSAVIRNIPDNVTAVGIPTTVIKKEGFIK
ncbi:acetyltransferase [Solibacillus silvestris]|uniref:acetyltransferase n=1 Tax=Solibacillus silvestris TaxID=76853 RepID=UPI003F812DEE